MAAVEMSTGYIAQAESSPRCAVYLDRVEFQIFSLLKAEGILCAFLPEEKAVALFPVENAGRAELAVENAGMESDKIGPGAGNNQPFLVGCNSQFHRVEAAIAHRSA